MKERDARSEAVAEEHEAEIVGLPSLVSTRVYLVIQHDNDGVAIMYTKSGTPILVIEPDEPVYQELLEDDAE